ncbi:MAG TPA: hypothetical protein VFK48_02955 [Usitatibacter sp.]|nr:hypothetical protein [Usitatibacter sp.]
MRTPITPGRLYASMSAEFKRLRPASCQWCRLPLPHLTQASSEEEANWALAELPSGCAECLPVIEDIMQRYQRRFEMRDPLATPLRAPPHAAPRPGTSLH